MQSNELQKAYEINQLRSDIQEIQNFLSGMFDRSKAIDILRKHHFTDFNIAIADLVLNVNETTLCIETPEKISWYLFSIQIYLLDKLNKKLCEE